MTSLWDPKLGVKTESLQDRTSPENNSTQSSTSPTQVSPLHARKDDHAQRKRNRIVVCLRLRAPLTMIVVLCSVSEEEIEMRQTVSLWSLHEARSSR
jgi:hypothetical protein